MSAAESLGPPFPPPPPVEDVAVALDAVGEVVSGTLDADEGVESGDSMGTKREKSATSAQSWMILAQLGLGWEGHSRGRMTARPQYSV